ncbi:MAG: trehalose-phosphatase [Terracidiphilus sp.]|jgi:trehalose 6-phosphate phosphatase
MAMRYLLSRAALPTVTRLARERTLCAFDFDGTLAPIAELPDQAAMRKRTRDLLRRLASLYPCIIVSGRNRADVLKKLSGLHVAGVLGNHGAESGTTPGSRKDVKQWMAALELELAPMPGTWIEDKESCLAIHYRQSPQKAEARRRILAAARKLKNVRVFGGKQVVNVVGDLAANKGHALAAARDRLQCNWVLYLGDDENDEDAFALGGNMVAVRIGRKQRTHARYYLRTQTEIDELLELLVQLREAEGRSR